MAFLLDRAFRLIPSAVFCTSPTDACSCKGGGFEIYDPFCNTSLIFFTEANETSSGNASTTAASVLALKMAKEEYEGIFDVLAGDTAIILVSVGVVILVIVVFTVARIYIAYTKAGDAQAEAERKASEAREQNLRLKEELKATMLDDEQVAMVQENAPVIEDKLPIHFKLDWEVLQFLERLGSGTFGDCFKGTKGGRLVAIKKMRAGEFR